MVASIPVLAHSLAPHAGLFLFRFAVRICRKQLCEAGSELVSFEFWCFTRSINFSQVYIDNHHEEQFAREQD